MRPASSRRGGRLDHADDAAVGARVPLLDLHRPGPARERGEHLEADAEIIEVGEVVEVAAQEVGARTAEDRTPGRVHLLPAALAVGDDDAERRLVERRRGVEAKQLQAGAARHGQPGRPRRSSLAGRQCLIVTPTARLIGAARANHVPPKAYLWVSGAALRDMLAHAPDILFWLEDVRRLRALPS
jgi:hypothetical protein